ncbi:erg24, C-14 sterol reductase [Tulasnella sp. 424]|nr:erg24, C-14 sterol reductase [Tulasnella sp. 424]KAG8980404.1 erg24, C-14 sterol reductase [Tulasnella sp. 425]
MTSTELTKAKKESSELNPRSQKLEFFGVPGTTILTLTVPLVPYGLYFTCSEEAGGCPPKLWDVVLLRVHELSSLDGWKSLWDTKAFTALTGWLVYLVVLWAILPGDWVEGLQLRDGTKRKYKINALGALFMTLGLVGGMIYNNGPQTFTFIYEHYLGLITATFVWSYVQSILLYIWSFYGHPKVLALAANSGYHIHDFWLGRELNPTIGNFDLKVFFELRPGLIGWVLINISCACEQAVRNGGKITDSMMLVLGFQGLYVLDAIYNEPAVLSTMDVVTDGFGLMLSFGDLCWLPMTYSLQARYLAFNPVELGWAGVAGVFIVHMIGYYIFRSANMEKNDFRNGQNPKNLSFMETKRGTRLLTSGWWGRSRHPNYMGDLIMALSWCLPTGFNTPITYFYPVYFLVLLVHRQRRDDEACHEKYGDDWLEYKKRVPYRIFPYIY